MTGYFLGLSADGWVALFTGLLFASTAGLWISTRRSITLARVSAELELRAYLYVAEAEFSWEKKAGGRWRADYAYRNAGKTPAHDVTIYYDLIVRESDDVAPFPDPTQEWKIGLMGPNGDNFWDWAFFEGDVPRDLHLALEQGVKSVYLFGRIEYRDEFDQHRQTRFRYVAGGENGFDDEFMVACQEGNETESRRPT